jgi:hypothetical protein
MKIAIPIILSLIFLNTGCILQQNQELPIITEKEYNKDEVLKDITFNLPQSYTNITISLSFTLPNGDITGTYQRHFSPGTITCIVLLQGILLYYPGLWHLDYQIFNGSTQVIEGDYNFWVQDDTQTLDRYELEQYTSTGYISILNNGKASGYVHIIVYKEDPITIDGIIVYGKEYFNKEVFLKPGYRFTETVTPNGKVRLNELVY